jgi:transposase-like protein
LPYVGFDGLWMKHKGEPFVILIAFDTETLDIIGYQISDKESETGWLSLINKYGKELQNLKGIYLDGDLNLIRAVKNNFPNVPIQLCVFHKEIRIGQIIPLVHLKTEEDKWLKEVSKAILYSDSEITALRYLFKLKIMKTLYPSKKKKEIYGVLNNNFNLMMTHHHYPNMHRTNNVLEGFNGNISQKLDIMRGFKKGMNIDRYLKLLFLNYRFREFHGSRFKHRNGKSPLELAGCTNVPKCHEWIEKHMRN